MKPIILQNWESIKVALAEATDQSWIDIVVAYADSWTSVSELSAYLSLTSTDDTVLLSNWWDNKYVVADISFTNTDDIVHTVLLKVDNGDTIYNIWKLIIPAWNTATLDDIWLATSSSWDTYKIMTDSNDDSPDYIVNKVDWDTLSVDTDNHIIKANVDWTTLEVDTTNHYIKVAQSYDDTLVHKSWDETINNTKTFTDIVKIDWAIDLVAWPDEWWFLLYDRTDTTYYATVETYDWAIRFNENSSWSFNLEFNDWDIIIKTDWKGIVFPDWTKQTSASSWWGVSLTYMAKYEWSLVEWVFEQQVIHTDSTVSYKYYLEDVPTSAVSTSTDADAAAGDTTISVESVDWFEVGDHIKVWDEDHIIDSIDVDNNDITLAEALANDQASGTAVDRYGRVTVRVQKWDDANWVWSDISVIDIFENDPTTNTVVVKDDDSADDLSTNDVIRFNITEVGDDFAWANLKVYFK